MTQYDTHWEKWDNKFNFVGLIIRWMYHTKNTQILPSDFHKTEVTGINSIYEFLLMEILCRRNLAMLFLIEPKKISMSNEIWFDCCNLIHQLKFQNVSLSNRRRNKKRSSNNQSTETFDKLNGFFSCMWIRSVVCVYELIFDWFSDNQFW